MKNTRSSEDEFIYSLNYLLMLNVFKPSSGYMNLKMKSWSNSL